MNDTPRTDAIMAEMKIDGRDRIVDAYSRADVLQFARTLERENNKLRAALMPFANYADKRARKPLKGLGNSVHSIHTGTEWEAEITLTDCERALAAVNSDAREG